MEQWGTPWEVRDGPQVPVSAGAQAEPSDKPGVLDGPCLSEAPMGWAASGCQERAVWVRALENSVWAALPTMCCWGRHGDKGRARGRAPAPGKSQQHSGQEKPRDVLLSQGCLSLGMWNNVMPLLSLSQPIELHCWRGMSETLPKNILMS